jgi:hypothetical protein
MRLILWQSIFTWAFPRVRNISIDTIGDAATDSTGVLAVTLNIPQVSLQELF